jgi:molybdenum cofactor cytidylyltransferase
MIFSEISVGNAAGSILAQTMRHVDWTVHKGHCLSAQDCSAFEGAGIQTIFAATLEDGDVREDKAAHQIANATAGANVSLTAAHTGRCNLRSENAGLVRIDSDTINRLNAVHESITIATLSDYAMVNPGQTIATIKIIPFAVSADVLNRVLDLSIGLGRPIVVRPFIGLSVAIINTTLPSLKDSVIAKTTNLTNRRIANLGGRVQEVFSCRHNEPDVSNAVTSVIANKPDLIVIVGASVTVDRRDVVPAGIVHAGGDIDHYGMPVDPGNLMLLAHFNKTPILVLPGCARSPKLNGIDWVLERFAAGLFVTSSDISALGVGGLLVDSPARPLPRDRAVQDDISGVGVPPISAIVLAAGQSRRMGLVNKLLEVIDGVPLIRRTVEAVQASKVGNIVVVTGHESEAVKTALSGLNVVFINNTNFEQGLSTSLDAGLAALSSADSGVVVCLGDMPQIKPSHINALIDQFDPKQGRAIGVPVHLGKRGNPILWARRFFEAMTDISGDVGARHLIGMNADLVYEVEFEDTAVLTDLDTPEQWSDFKKGRVV